MKKLIVAYIANSCNCPNWKNQVNIDFLAVACRFIARKYPSTLVKTENHEQFCAYKTVTLESTHLNSAC